MSDNVRIDLNQTLRHRLIEKYGPSIGPRIAEAIQECIVAGHTGTALRDCIKGRLKDLITAGNVTDVNLDNIMSLMGHWVTVG
ncbi:MAG: hypothetical protein HWN81_14585 [Candidatus Lokiarchaeota archaeon]|nr:hypothetical protein [Candidatus Lokiarchaeota archaeon]